MLHEDVRFLLCEDIAHHAAPHTGQHADKYRQKQVAAVAAVDGHIDAGHRESAQTDGVGNVDHGRQMMGEHPGNRL